jgi:hypothetical protein
MADLSNLIDRLCALKGGEAAALSRLLAEKWHVSAAIAGSTADMARTNEMPGFYR